MHDSPRPQASPSELSAPRCKQHPERLAVGGCPRCGDYACELCLNEDGLCPACEGSIDLPWENRANTGFFSAFLRTIWLALAKPRQFARGVGRARSRYDALLFGCLCVFASTVVGALLMAVLVGIIADIQKAKFPDAAPPPSYLGVAIAGGYLVFGMLTYAFGSVAWAGVLRLSCMMFGVNVRGGRLWRILMYCSAPLLAGWVPIFGLGATLYSGVLVGLCVSELGKVSIPRALTAVLVPCAIVCTLVAVGYFLLLLGMLARTVPTSG